MAYGDRFRITLFGSSHGPEVGVSVAGIPAGTPIDPGLIQADLDRRRPVGRRLATRRQEEDRLVIDAGVVDGRADGSLFRAHVANEDVRREPYDRMQDTPRPGHADFPARVRYGVEADLSGGGIFSGRMTVGLVIAGSVAKRLLGARGVEVVAFTRSVGTVEAVVGEEEPIASIVERARTNEVGCPDLDAARRMEDEIANARREGDSVGGVIEVRASGLPVGLGEPFFDSVESAVAHLAFSVPAVKAVEFGAGFRSARMKGSEHNDPFVWADGAVRTESNHAG
ncbi:MAG TPA: chorismate synthase, partial [Thermoplasmata archaeon]|nr:chorismate synthase [Thermoplasmata archaeon]